LLIVIKYYIIFWGNQGHNICLIIFCGIGVEVILYW